MKILVVGSGGREHALAWKIAQGGRRPQIFCAPGNAGTASFAKNEPIRAEDVGALLAFAKKEEIDLTVVGPEGPLAAGIVDHFEAEGLKIFGPSQKAAQLEASKVFAKDVMNRCGVPTARAVTCWDVRAVAEAAGGFGLPVVLKADGLAAGKGVVICASSGEVEAAAKAMLESKVFGEAGRSVVVEEFLKGEEASLLFLTNGLEAVPLASSQDHKRVFDHDEGPNTGGMGAYSPAPVVTPGLLDDVTSRVVRPVLERLQEDGIRYRGILYAGIMVTKEGPKVLEFNARFGDPETQAVLMRLDSDIVDMMLWTLTDDPAPQLSWRNESSVCVVMTSGGYPGPYKSGFEISGLDEAAAMKDVVVFHAGAQAGPERPLTHGGRVLGVTALGDTIKEARDLAYRAVDKIRFEKMHFRRDIAWRALKENQE